MKNEFIIRSFTNKDLTAVQNLFRLCFNQRDLQETCYRWRFLDNPDKKTFIYLAFNKEQLISHYAVCPSYSYFSGKYFLSSLSMHTMTHPQFNGQGLFPKLAEQLYQHIHNNDQVKLVYGFPNINSHYSFIKKLNWKDVFLIPTMKLNLKSSKCSDYIPKVLEYFNPASFNTLWENISTASTMFFPNARTAEYIEWRYLKCPVNDYKILVWENGNELSAYAVIKKYINQGVTEMDLVDIMKLDSASPFEILRDILNYGLINDYSAINAWFPLGSEWYAAAEKSGFTPGTPLTYLGFRSFEEYHPADFRVPANWYITMSDSDVY